MKVSVLLLAIGVLLTLRDQLVGVRLRQGGETTLADRARFAWKERRWTIAGSAFVVASIIAQFIES